MLKNVNKKNDIESIINTTCKSHCGGICPLIAHVKDGKITRLEAEDEIRACAKGRASRQVEYATDRILYPLKRTGERGSGEFKKIPWDEALDTTAFEIKRIRAKYGSSGILFFFSAGDMNYLNNYGIFEYLLANTGGYSGCYAKASGEGSTFASSMTYGIGIHGAQTRDNWPHSRLIILWGFNPVVSHNKGKAGFYLAQAKASGTRIVSVDPRYTDSASAFSNAWIPIKPGTDAAMLIAMAYVIISEHLQDQAFIDKYTLGYDIYKKYIMGKEDGVDKTPLWAEKITGVPASTIAELAREYAINKPAALLDGDAPGRTAYGEQFHRAAIALAAITGNMGILGGSAPGSVYSVYYSRIALSPTVWERMPNRENPVDEASPPRLDAGPYKGSSFGSSARFNSMDMIEALLKGRAGGYPADYKLLFIYNCNVVNQHGNINKMAKALKQPEFILSFDQFMTATAKFADIVFPTNTFMERNDLAPGHLNLFYGYVNKLVEPSGETKSQFEIAKELGARLGMTNFSKNTADEWLKEAVAACKDIPDYSKFKKKGIQKVKLLKPVVSFEEQIIDPVNHPFLTPSGKIEIYSKEIATINKENLPAIPKYIEPWEGPNDPLISKYPLQLITSHDLRRAHSQYHSIPWLKELYLHAAMINTSDAKTRGIKDGDMIKIFNDRGMTIIPANVTDRIMPGVVDLSEGAWYDPDKNGIDRGGSANVLIKDGHSPGGAFPANTALVQIEKA
ncbi:MAG: molybdopterin-dependent oxidoreductase [Chloroflexi bacterium]|nr:molybdopterin-dependent oxidoreductase [Chloroflexota bacterium]